MADLPRYRGAVSALLAAGFAAAVVVGGASAIVQARGSDKPAASTTIKSSSRPHAAGGVREQAEPAAVKVKGLAKWRPPHVPKRLKLKPVVRHVHKVVTVVSAVAVAPAAPAATSAAPVERKARPQRKATKRHKVHVARKHKEHEGDDEEKHAAKRPPAPAPATNPAPGNETATGAPAVSPPQVPPPPAAPPPAPTPTGAVALIGGKSIGQTLTARWTGADPTATTYQWQLCNPDGNACQPIPNETNQTYVLRASDLGLTIRVLAVSGAYSSTSRATDQIESGG